MLFIDVKELELIGWLAQQALPCLKKLSDKRFAKKAMKKYNSMVKTICSWEKK